VTDIGRGASVRKINTGKRLRCGLGNGLNVRVDMLEVQLGIDLGLSCVLGLK